MLNFSSIFGVTLPLVVVIAGTLKANALTITQLSDQNVKNGFAITACVDVGGASTANGTKVGPFPCNNQFNEQWIYLNGQFLGLGTCCGNGTFPGASTCLSVHDNSINAGSLVELDACVIRNSTQLWEPRYDGSIINMGANKCLDSQGQIGGGFQLVINTCNGSAGQKWNLK
ncbi:ricin-type beta-trefoil lectin protein [Roseiarcus fermentans]|uniref:Ricin-type beta-trefoil lectin protein n=1 Tax=Roseiarcus fermentans TaxID=1473586 RepID=A0A366FET7_9HYPH|nr:RICIN domain-containing protein [Roseiarcus fermentans]RBP12249.1 ricin-type beta-trefoil lectin protein [Roseiarcus fermentans]